MSPNVLDYHTPKNKPRWAFVQGITIVILISAVCGLLWEIAAVFLTGGHSADALQFSVVAAGVSAGISAGLFTVWSRVHTRGRESVFWTLATYYLGILWFVCGWLAAGALAGWAGGRGGRSWELIDLSEASSFLIALFVFGTFPYGLVLIPACLLNRMLVWRLYRSFTEAKQ